MNIYGLVDLAIITSVAAAAVLLIKVVFREKLSARMHVFIWLILLAQIICFPMKGLLPEGNLAQSDVQGNALAGLIAPETVLLCVAAFLFIAFAVRYILFLRKHSVLSPCEDADTLDLLSGLYRCTT